MLPDLRRKLARSLRPVVLLAVSLAVAQASAAQSLRLNGPLERARGGGVTLVSTSPDGAWVVYAGTEDAQVPGLFSAPVDGSAPGVRIEPQGGVVEVSTQRVYVQNPDGVFAAPLGGGAARLLLPSVPGTFLDRMRVSPDEQHLVYLAATPTSGGWHLYSASLLGAPGEGAVLLGGPVFPSEDIRITPDGRRVVFVAEEETPGVFELLSAALDGSTPALRLNEPLPPQGNVRFGNRAFQLTPDGERVVYVVDRPAESAELFSVPVDGSARPLALSRAPVDGGIVREFQITSDGGRVVYSAVSVGDSRADLFETPIDGRSSPVKVNGDFGDVIGFEVGPRGRFVVFLAGGFLQRQWCSGPLTGVSAPAPLPFAPLDGIQFSPDGERIVYRINRSTHLDLCSLSLASQQWIELTGTPSVADQVVSSPAVGRDDAVLYFETIQGTLQLRKVPIAGGDPAVLSAFPAGVWATWIGPIGALRLTPEGRRVLYLSDANVDQVYELFSLAVDGGSEPVRLNGDLVTEHVIADVTSFRVGPDGQAATFTVHAPGPHDPGHGQLYGVRLDPRALGSGARPVELYAEPSGFVGEHEIAPGGERVVFKAGDVDSGLDLFSIPIDGGVPAVQLNDPTTSSFGVGAFRPSPDGRRVGFTANQGEESELYGVAIDGGPELELSGALVEGGHISTFSWTPDGAWVVYVADQLSDNVFELFSVPIDGSASARRLNAPLVSGGDVTLGSERAGFVLAPDGRTVLYRADQERDDVFELYLVPVDGSAPPRKISGALTDGGDVLGEFRFTSDGTSVVYRADQERDDVLELWRAALDGTSVRLSGALVDGGDVQPDFELAPGGTALVYRADQEHDEDIELYRVALDGSSAPAHLNANLVAGGDVQSFRIGPDGHDVVYRADQRTDERFELYRVPLEGGPVLTLSGPLAFEGDVLEGFRITPDGARVVYGADQEQHGVFELYSAPLTREKGSVRLNAPLVSGGDAALEVAFGGPPAPLRSQFSFGADGQSVVYLADQERDEVFELYLSFLTRPFHLPSVR